MLAEDVLNLDELDADTRSRVMAAVRQDPALAVWMRAMVALRADLDFDQCSPAEIAQYVVAQRDGAIELPLDVRQRVDGLRNRHPGFDAHINQLEADASLFDAVWDEASWEEPQPQRRRRQRRDDNLASRDREALHRARRRGMLIWRGVAVLSVVVFGLITSLLGTREQQMLAVTNDSGAVQTIVLADGSRVQLAPGSTLHHFGSEEGLLAHRKTSLSGEAFFDVTPGPIPFVVYTNEGIATVLGTSFSISTHDGRTDVRLLEGKLTLAPSVGEAITLYPRDGAQMFAEAPMQVARGEIADGALVWHGQIIFRSTPLKDVAQTLQQAYGVTIDLSERLTTERITGTFEQEAGVEMIIETLSATLGVEAVWLDAAQVALR